jgi:thiosulfate dehydrogenase [quinone] large subunit
MQKDLEFPIPPITRFIFANTKMSWLWLIVRLYVGYEWLMAGWGKLGNPAWTGDHAGTAIKGFLTGSLAKAVGEHPDVSGWYASFINNFAMHHTVGFSYLVTYGEIAVGVALILGIFTGVAAFFGAFMNLNYLFAGTVSMNPLLLILQLFLVLAWRIAGWIGMDRFILSAVGTPWRPGKLFRR